MAQQLQNHEGSGLVTMGDNLPSHPNPLGASSSSVPIQSYQSFFLIHIYVDQGIPVPVGPTCDAMCRRAAAWVTQVCGWVAATRSMRPRACARLPPSLPPRTRSSLPQPAVPCRCPCSSGHLPSAAASPPFPTADQLSADQDPSRLRYPRAKDRS